MGVLPQRHNRTEDARTIRTGGARRSGSTAPGGAVEGDLWYESDSDLLRAYNATDWVPMNPVTYYTAATATPGSTASGAFVSFPGPLTKSITKLATATAFNVVGHVSCYKTINTGYVDFGLLLNGVDYWMSRFFFNNVGMHMESPFTGVIGSGLAPGTYIVTLRWRVGSADGNADANDFIHISYREGLTG